MSFLAIDIGNTRLKWGHYASPQPGAALLAHGAVFLEAIDSLAETEWQDLSAPASVLGCVVAGEAVKNGYEHPSRLGTDRWVSLIGARHRVLAAGTARPALVVMVGTAVTVDALDAEGRFLGGLILPGFGLMLRALEMGTAGLKVPTGEVVDFPSNTSDALMSGGAHAIAGAVERIHRRLIERTGEHPLLLMTGGAAVKLAPITDLPFETVDTLIFEGLLHLQSHRLAL
jgi:type III pantothenate kinase